MGIVQKHYVMMGFQIDPDDFDEEDWEDLYNQYGEDATDGYFILYDGMNGEYTIFGRVIASGDMFDGVKLTSIDMFELNEVKREVEDKFYDLFDNADQEASLFVVTHYR